MAGSDFQVEGFAELDAVIADMRRSTARGVLQRALLIEGRKIAADARARAPGPDSTGALRRSIIATTRRPANEDAGLRAFGETLQSGGTRDEAVGALRAARRANPNAFAEVFVGPGRHPQAIFQEFGTYKEPAQEFLLPAWKAAQPGLIEGLRATLAAEIGKTLARLARRAAK
jgi:HK97 gp10 family phage protein